jgi:uncharacterized protein
MGDLSTNPIGIHQGISQFSRHPGSKKAGRVLGPPRTHSALSGHRFWEDRIDLSDSDSWGITHLTGYRQVTDAHLLAIAMDHGGCLATLDRAIATLPLPGKSAKQHVWVVLDEK